VHDAFGMGGVEGVSQLDADLKQAVGGQRTGV
jgi:hypothetical protein